MTPGGVGFRAPQMIAPNEPPSTPVSSAAISVASPAASAVLELPSPAGPYGGPLKRTAMTALVRAPL